MLDELLAECAALMGVLDRLLVAYTGESNALNDDADTLVVEVCHDNWLNVSNRFNIKHQEKLPLKPWFSFPIKFSTGTLTSSKVMYVVPLDQTPWQSIFLVLTPPILLSIRRTETPFM